MKKALALLMALLCLPLLSGCGLSVMERQTFVLCLSLDVDKEGKLTLGVQSPMNGSGTSSAASPEYTVFSATGDDFESTLAMLAASTPCSLNFCQLKFCVISYALASKEPLRPLLMKLARLPTMRPTAIVIVALGNAQEIIKTQNPDFGMRMSTHLSIYTERLKTLRLSPCTTLMECVRDIDSGRVDPLLSVCAVNPALKPKEEKQSGEKETTDNDKQKESVGVFARGEPWSDKLLAENAIAGALPRTGDNPVEYLGSAVIADGKVAGLLSAEETQIALRLRYEATLKIALNGSQVQYQVWLEPHAEPIPADKARAVISKLQSLHGDVLGLGGLSATAVYTNAQWRAMDFQTRYPAAEIVVFP